MARKLYNLARMTTSTTGTGTITLGSAVTGFLTFATAGVSNGEIVEYTIRDGSDSENGYGTYTSSGTTLTRNVAKSTNGDAAIDLSGSAEVAISPIASSFPIGRQTIWIPAGAMIASTTAGATAGTVEESTNDQNYNTMDFATDADDHAEFQIPFPNSWDLGTLNFRVYWRSTATDTDGVSFGFQAVAIADNQAIDASWGTAVVVDDANQGAAGELLVSAISGAVTVAGSPGDGELVFGRLFRDVSDSNDTAGEDAQVIGAHIYYEVDAGQDA